MDTERKFSPRFAFHALNISIVVVFFALVLLQNAFGDVWQKYQKDIIAIRQLTPSPTPQVLAATDNVLWLVTKVVDGDTIEVQFEGVKETIRFIGIDTPETKDPRKPVQCFGKEASAKTSELLKNQFVRLESDSSQSNRDVYKRLLRYVYRDDGLFVNKLLIEEGFAYEYTYKSNPYIYQKDFIEAQHLAQEQQKGLWGQDVCPQDPRVTGAAL